MPASCPGFRLCLTRVPDAVQRARSACPMFQMGGAVHCCPGSPQKEGHPYLGGPGSAAHHYVPKRRFVLRCARDTRCNNEL
jgi:hypothetical protein